MENLRKKREVVELKTSGGGTEWVCLEKKTEEDAIIK